MGCLDLAFILCQQEKVKLLQIPSSSEGLCLSKSTPECWAPWLGQRWVETKGLLRWAQGYPALTYGGTFCSGWHCSTDRNMTR